MGNINTVAIDGNLVRDAELKHLGEKQTALASFTIANNRGFGDRKYVNYISVDLWGKAAEALVQYLTKGKHVAVDGELRQERWETDGGKRDKIKIIANTISLGAGGTKHEGDEAPVYNETKHDDDIPF